MLQNVAGNFRILFFSVVLYPAALDLNTRLNPHHTIDIEFAVYY